MKKFTDSMVNLYIAMGIVLIGILGGLLYRDTRPRIVENCWGIYSKKPLTKITGEFLKAAILHKANFNHVRCKHYADVKWGNEEMTFEEFLSRTEVQFISTLKEKI